MNVADEQQQGEEQGEEVTEEEVAALAACFYDTSAGPASELDLAELMAALQEQVIQPGLPQFLSALWRHCSTWHLIPEHYEVYGLNIFPPNQALSLGVQVFGGEEMVEEWRGGHGTPNSADPGWVCFASYSEFDYLFTCMDLESLHFGAIRRVINNCYEDNPVPRMSAATFIRQIRRFAAANTPDADITFEDFVMKPPALK